MSMSHELFRKRIISNIRKAVWDSENASDIEHPGIRGRVREIALSSLFEPILPGDFKIGTGTIIDFSGFQSPEIDLVIYNNEVLPSILYSERDGQFPAESCFFAIETKSKLNSTELNKSIKNANKLNNLKYISGYYQNGAPIQHVIQKVTPLLFSFKTDLELNGKTELERYAEIDKDYMTNPAIRFICVIGRGYWHFDDRSKEWICNPSTDEYDEVIEFLSLIVNCLPDMKIFRGRPHLGDYLTKSDRMKDIRKLP